MTSNRLARIIPFTTALAFATVASAGLQDRPRKGVTPTGTAWLSDPYRSGDPNASCVPGRRPLSMEAP